MNYMVIEQIGNQEGTYRVDCALTDAEKLRDSFKGSGLVVGDQVEQDDNYGRLHYQGGSFYQLLAVVGDHKWEMVGCSSTGINKLHTGGKFISARYVFKKSH